MAPEATQDRCRVHELKDTYSDSRNGGKVLMVVATCQRRFTVDLLISLANWQSSRIDYFRSCWLRGGMHVHGSTETRLSKFSSCSDNCPKSLRGRVYPCCLVGKIHSEGTVLILNKCKDESALTVALQFVSECKYCRARQSL